MNLQLKRQFKKAVRYKPYWKDNGGITVSGGEPLLQIDFVIELFTLAKAQGIHTTLDTSGNPFSDAPEFMEKFDRLMEVTDLFMLDIKEMDESKHKKLTDTPTRILSPWVIIFPLTVVLCGYATYWFQGLPMTMKGLKALKTKLDQWGDCVERVEILPYHTLGLAKWKKLNIDYPLDGVRVPTQEEVAHAEEMLGIQK